MNPVELIDISTALPKRGLKYLYQDLKRTWNRAKEEGSDTLTISKRNYKVYANFFVRQTAISRNISVLDTCAGPNFVHTSQLSD